MNKEQIIDKIAAMWVLHARYEKHFDAMTQIVEHEKWEEKEQLTEALRCCDYALSGLYHRIKEIKQELE